MTTSFLLMLIAYPCLTNSRTFDVSWLGYIGMTLAIQFAIVAVPLFAILVPFIVIDAVASWNLDEPSANNEDAEPSDAPESR